MSSNIKKLINEELINPPRFVADGLQYETIMGSEAYGVSSNDSDRDIYSWCIPPLEIIYPHIAGYIDGFGKKRPGFDQYSIHHIQFNNRKYDLAVYSIIKYFNLVMQNNPNMLDSLFVSDRCITYITPIGQLVRDNRRMFLHKGCWHKFKGYAYSQMHKIKTKNPDEGSNRYKDVQKHGFDLKFSYHVVRLLGEVEQILTESDLDLQRNREQLKAIRNGEWTIAQIETYFLDKEKSLEDAYTKSELPYFPDEEAIKQLLLKCIEQYYGSIDKYICVKDSSKQMSKDIQKVLDRYGG